MSRPVVILGAGLAGLSAAYHLKREHVLLEKESRPGGLVRTESQNGFHFDYTGHFLHFRTQECKDLVLKKILKRNQSSHVRRSSIYSHGTMTRYPFQANTLGLPQSVVQECLRGLLWARYRHKRKKKYADFLSWIMATSGPGIARHFMVPYNTKIWTVPPHQMTPEWIGRFVPQPQVDDFLQGALLDEERGMGYNATFHYPKKGGIEALSRGFAAGIEDLYTQCAVTRVILRHKLVEVRGEYQIPYSDLVSTLPLPVLIRLMGDEVPSGVQQAARRLRWNSVYNINLGLDREDTGQAHWVYFPEKQFPFYRVGFPSRINGAGMAPRGKSSLNAEVSVRQGARVSARVLVGRVKQGLVWAGLLRRGERLLAEKVLFIPHAYVIYDREHRANVALIQRFLRTKGIRSIGRYGSWEYSAMEDAMLAGKRAAGQVDRGEKLSA